MDSRDADLREKYPLLVVMRDNTKDNRSKAICNYFTLMSVDNYYSACYELWQNGLAEALIKLTIMVSVVEENLHATLQLNTQHAFVGKGRTHERS